MTLVIAAVGLLALTGCFRYGAEGRIDANGLVSGSIVIGYDQDFVKEQPGLGSYQDLGRFMKSNAASVSRGTASVQPMNEGRFRGFRTTFSEVALTDFVQLMRHEQVRPGETGGVDYRLNRQGDEFVFDARVLADKGKLPIPEEVFKTAEVAVSLTFPGPVVTSNGTVSGNTVTWHPSITEAPHLTATGKSTQPRAQPNAGSTPVAGEEAQTNGLRAPLTAAAITLLAAAAILGAWLALRRRSS